MNLKFWTWFKSNKERQPVHVPPDTPKSAMDAWRDFEDEETGERYTGARILDSVMLDILKPVQPVVDGHAAMDSVDGTDSQGGPFAPKFNNAQPNLSDALLGFFLRQQFIGHNLAALLSQHWMINKVCTMPARDAVRNWFKIRTGDGDELKDVRVLRAMERIDKRMTLKKQTLEFIRKGRIFGVRIAMYKVDSLDPDYYVNPFNIDGVEPGAYKGIVQIDPYWCAPMLDQEAASEPDSQNFYEPTYWQINGKRVHNSHLCIYRHDEVVDVLKPQYQYGGVPVPQQIVERVYAAERVANEAPLLAMNKRMTVFKTNLSTFLAKGKKAFQQIANWAKFRDNHTVKLADASEDIQQFDTSLTDFDSLISNGYQLVAAAGEVPATKILQTQPKGFNSSGDYEEASYHESLESIQEHDATPLIDRHHLLTMKSHVGPWMRKNHDPQFVDIDTSIMWNPLDTPTALEKAQTELAKAQAGSTLATTGAIDGYDERDRVANDEESNYTGLARVDRPAAKTSPYDNEGVTPGDTGAKLETGGAQQQTAVAKQDAVTKGDGSGSGQDSMDMQPKVFLVSNQDYLNPDIVAIKRAQQDYNVQVSPRMTDPDSGLAYRIVIDGHHSLAAANADGVPPNLIESGITGNYAVVAGS
jgi:phage-related protein (TIGR01555 family)